MEEKIQQYQTKYIPNVVKQMVQITQALRNLRWTSHFYERAKLKLEPPNANANSKEIVARPQNSRIRVRRHRFIVNSIARLHKYPLR